MIKKNGKGLLSWEGWLPNQPTENSRVIIVPKRLGSVNPCGRVGGRVKND